MEAPNLEKESINHSSFSSCLNSSTAMQEEEDARIIQKQDNFNHSSNLILDRIISISSKELKANPCKKSKIRVFSCNYCTQKFCNGQALGGHQNAHKRERLIVKQRQRHLAAVVALRLWYSRVTWLPLLHGGGSLGMQVRSTIHKPYVGVPMFPRRLGVGWQEVAENGGGAASFDGCWSVPMEVDGSGGFICGGGLQQEFN